MAFSKAEEFSESDQVLADLAKAIAHPARIAILRILASRHECVCGELVSSLPLAQSTVSQHVKALREAGLIRGEVEGPRSCYCIDPETWKEFESQFTQLAKAIRAPKGCC
jgi:ArsR family transcriptional regulator, arsenate/arsenite/antimonite-responsive transcriptional repressor